MGTKLEGDVSENKRSHCRHTRMSHFRQLRDQRSRSFTYLIADATAREAVIIDPCPGQGTLYLALLDEIQARLARILLTHVHRGGDLAGIPELQSATGAQLICGRACPLPSAFAPTAVADGDVVTFGDQLIHCRTTPGHTLGCVAYQWRDRLFVGDVLSLADFPDGSESAEEDSGVLFDSITRKLMPLADETLVYPAHDYSGRRVSCIGEERDDNPAFTGTSRDEFIGKRRRLARAESIIHAASPRRSQS
jgi:sulfur dioxygenase